MAAGIEHIADIRIPQKESLAFVGTALQIEQRNLAMNEFVAGLIEKLRQNDVYALLVKGQGISQCYERPLWRASGDVDLLLSEANYQKAAKVLAPLTSKVDKEDQYRRHLAMHFDSFEVELHGTLRSGFWRKLDREVDEVQKSVFCQGKVRSWINGKTCVFLPNADEDVVFVFSHILQHYYKEGIGLRQVCDWCRLLWTYRDSLDCSLLESRIQRMGAVTEWKAFAALAVEYLGMPVEAMPFYSASGKWKRKASKILTFIIETGNFGHNRDYSYRRKYPYLVFKAISLWRHIIDFTRYLGIFPMDSIKVWLAMLRTGFSVAVKGI